MPLDSHVKAYSLSDVKITNIAGTTQVDLPSAMTLRFSEVFHSGELFGDNATQAVATFSDKVEWTLESGGIPLTAYALLTGRTLTAAGTTPSQTNTLTGAANQSVPYVKIYGKVLTDGTDDIHCMIYKAKITGNIEGSFSAKEFIVTSCSGVGISNGTKIFDFIQNETATTLSAT